MIIDLKDGYICINSDTTDAHVHFGVLGSGLGDNHYFEIDSDIGNPLMRIDNREYFLQSDDYNGIDTGVKIDLSNGNIIGYDLTLQIGTNPDIVLTSNTSSKYFPFYAIKGYIGGFSIGETAMIGDPKFTTYAGDKIHSETTVINNQYEVYWSRSGMSFGKGSLLIGERKVLSSQVNEKEDPKKESSDNNEGLTGWSLQLACGKSAILDEAGKWILGKNHFGRAQLGTWTQEGNTHIYCGKGQEIRLRDFNDGNSIARFSKTLIKFNVDADQQEGIYARFA